jgi:hypothetical protein
VLRAVAPLVEPPDPMLESVLARRRRAGADSLGVNLENYAVGSNANSVARDSSASGSGGRNAVPAKESAR